MTPALLAQLQATVRRQPTRLTRLHAEARDGGTPWSQEQLRLLLECFEAFHFSDPNAENPEVSVGELTHEEALLAAVREILGTQPGRPMPLPRVIELLPPQLATSIEQLRALVAKTTDIEIRGPMIRRNPGN